MSDLAEIAAAAGITILESDVTDGEREALEYISSADHVQGGNEDTNSNLVAELDPCTLGEVEALEEMFSQRYSPADPEYAQVLEDKAGTWHPPCIPGYSGRRQDNRSWDRNRDRGHRPSWDSGDRESHGQRQLWNDGDWREHRDRRDFSNRDYHCGRDSYSRPQSYGDYHRSRHDSNYRGSFARSRSPR